MLIYMVTFFILYFSSFVVFLVKRKHLLVMLLGMELSVVALFLGLFLLLSQMNYEYFFLMVFLTMSVCEGALSLSLLVLMVRMHGNDFILSFNFLW
uniref:NADH-ubiquinone oxidoreductase chain 4L n=1 Tax=Liophloeus tessulatus TaxID=202024 RepID=J9PIN9_9CUCU|nr:NADH dehydrogenase subunit 4L [Liophloeus tessulatus]